MSVGTPRASSRKESGSELPHSKAALYVLVPNLKIILNLHPKSDPAGVEQ